MKNSVEPDPETVACAKSPDGEHDVYWVHRGGERTPRYGLCRWCGKSFPGAFGPPLDDFGRPL